MKADLLLLNGHIVTMSENAKKADWVAVKDGLIIGRGSGDDYKNYASVEVIDLKGKTVLPGLFDSHVHVINTGISLNSVDLLKAADLEEVLDKIEGRCKSSGEEWVFASNYIPQNIKEGRYPSRWELDNISQGKKVMVIAATVHGCSVNSAAMDVASVPDGTPGVVMENNQAAGIYLSDESAFLAISNVFGSLPETVVWKMIEDCINYSVQKGVTTMHGLFGQFVKGDTDLKLIMEKGNALPIDVEILYQTWDVNEVLQLGLSRIGGCLTLDGALFEMTMANFEPYDYNPALRGVLYHNDEEVYKLISDAHKNDLQCCVHAVGERAIDQLIHSYRRVILEQGEKDLRHRIEHFCLPTENQIEMAKEFKIVLSMQPGFTYFWDRASGGEFEMFLGRERANRWDPFHRIIDAGCLICGGSDSPVTPIEPLIDIASCVNGPNPIRNISVDEAIRMYTVNAAYAVHLEKTKGSIDTGKEADFTVLNLNPYEYADSKEIYNIEADMTIKGGKVIHKANFS